MNFLKKIFLTLGVIILVIFFALHAFISIKGRDLLTRKLGSVFQSEVIIGRVTTGFPLQIIVKDLEVKHWFKIKKALAGTGIIDVFGGNFVLSDLKVEGIEFELEKRKRQAEPEPEKAVDSQAGQDASNAPVPTAGIESVEDFFLSQRIFLRRLIISDGTLVYTDYTKGEIPIKLKIKDLNVRVENFQWPFLNSSAVSFELSGRIPWENVKEDGRIEFAGWINFFKKDMSAKLEIKGIDGIYIYPYYSSLVDIDKARVEKARLNFTSNITSFNNDVTAPCHLELTQISFKPKDNQDKEDRMEKITNVVLGLFKAMDQGKIVLNFNLKTKLDGPEFGLGIIQEALKEKIILSRKSQGSGAMEIIKFPGKIVEGTFLSFTGLTKSLINGTLNVGRELRDTVKGSFTRRDNRIINNSAVAENQTK